MLISEILPDDPADEVKRKIGEAYRQLGYATCWTFMMCPEERLYRARVMLVGLNPGGGPDCTKPNGGYEESWDCPKGNDYWVGDWKCRGPGKEPLQQQVQRLMGALNVPEEALFAAQFVPFRSERWSTLPRKTDALEFSRGLWRWVLKHNQSATLIFTLGHTAGVEMAQLLNLSEQLPPICCGWRSQRIRRYNGNGRTLVSLPHMSRYKIFGREGRPAEIALSDILDGILKVSLDQP